MAARFRALPQLIELTAQRGELLLDRGQARFERLAARESRERAVDPIDAVLQTLHAMRHRPQPARQALDVAGGGDVQRPHRHLLGLGRLLASLERA